MVRIRKEQATDREALRCLIETAFNGMPYAAGDEQDLLDKLEHADALSLSLVAVDDDDIIGQVAFSPAQNEDNSAPWYALGPVAVSPAYQRKGIGSQLILAGLEELQSNAALGCILVGATEYYARFGFLLDPASCPKQEPEAHFMLRTFTDKKPRGRFTFHPAFYNLT